MKNFLSSVSIIGLSISVCTLVFVELGILPIFSSFKPSYEAAMAYGVLSLAASSLLCQLNNHK
ncbi:MAG: hypothetical protein ACXWRZ_04490 [Bdellovibrio sp.]